MFNKHILFSKNPLLDLVLKVALSLAIFCVIAPLKLELSTEIDAVPITFGSLLACLLPAVFGWRIGGIAALSYVVLGILGLPIFAGYGGGLHYLIPSVEKGYSLSTGFLFGFIMAGFLVGFLAEKMTGAQILKSLGLYFLGHLVILSMGYIHILQVKPEIDLAHSIKSLLPGLLIKAAIFMTIIQMLGRKLQPGQAYER
ncbi:MAG: biotin transporter BioY [Flavobacteriales bacterium]